MSFDLKSQVTPAFAPLPPISELCFAGAGELLGLLERGEISARELMTVHIDQADRFNPAINALCTRVPAEVLLEQADQSDARRSQGVAGPLDGLPYAVKDLTATRGIRTTMGSVHTDTVPAYDAFFVERIREAGAIIIGKTNTPEFGAGSHTFNDLFGVTRNPYALDRTAGGSSGGAAAALACGLVPLADGSDMGGSLRNPAAFCNVVGMRPSMGRVPSVPLPMAWQSRLSVEGPMARSVGDCALLLSVMAGGDARDPGSLIPSEDFDIGIGDAGVSGKRVAFTPDLGGLPVAGEVKRVFAGAVGTFDELGCTLEEAHPDVAGAMDVFRTLRAHQFAASLGALVRRGAKLKPSLRANVEAGFALTAQDLARADVQRTALYQRFCAFFERFDYLVLPSTQVAPFDLRQEWVDVIDGQAMADYLEWMSICCIISVTGLPAISVPCGFTGGGLPVGLQIVGAPQADRAVLELAAAFEATTRHAAVRPGLFAPLD